MYMHHFTDEDLKVLASLALDICVDNMMFKVVKVVKPDDNFWSYDCRFAVDEKELDTYYDSFHFDCGRDNDPSTYQMCWTEKKKEMFRTKPIVSPLLVVHYFEQMCKKQNIIKN